MKIWAALFAALIFCVPLSALAQSKDVTDLNSQIIAPTVHVIARMGSVKLVDTSLDIRQAQERTVVQFKLSGGQLVPDSSNSVFVPLRSASK